MCRVISYSLGMNSYRKTSHISRTLVGNKIVDNSFSTQYLASMDGAKTTARLYKKHLNFGIWCDLYKRFYGNTHFIFVHLIFLTWYVWFFFVFFFFFWGGGHCVVCIHIHVGKTHPYGCPKMSVNKFSFTLLCNVIVSICSLFISIPFLLKLFWNLGAGLANLIACQ